MKQEVALLRQTLASLLQLGILASTAAIKEAENKQNTTYLQANSKQANSKQPTLQYKQQITAKMSQISQALFSAQIITLLLHLFSATGELYGLSIPIGDSLL